MDVTAAVASGASDATAAGRGCHGLLPTVTSLETQEFCLRESKKCAAVGRRMDGLAGARIRIG